MHPSMPRACSCWLPIPCGCSDQVDGAGIVLSIESRSSEALAAACDRLKELLPGEAVISEHRDCTAINTPVASPPGVAMVAAADGGGGVRATLAEAESADAAATHADGPADRSA